VARAFNATTNINSAARIINQFPPDEVFRRLCEQLPHAETRTYIVAVVERQGRYRSMDPITEPASAPH
jgi:hypothetical protein